MAIVETMATLFCFIFLRGLGLWRVAMMGLGEIVCLTLLSHF